MIVPVILAGGSGSRLWPLSRSGYPKQLLPLVSGRTMLQDTILRARSLTSVLPPLIIGNQEHRFLMAEQLKKINTKDAKIILEPMGKNTAPAAAIAALFLSQYYQSDTTMLIMPADHVLQDASVFNTAVMDATQNAMADKLVTFGIKPNRPETGYGYIKTVGHCNSNHAYQIEQFIEKPNQQDAEHYVESGHYYWNSGMFLFKASRYLAELELYSPDILQICQKAVSRMTADLDFCRLDNIVFATCPSNSIDYAVMEKTQNAVVVPLETAWSDVGSWTSLSEVHQPDEDGNVVQGDVITRDVKDSYIRAESRMLAVVGVQNHIVVETSDAVLVAHKDHAQGVKEIVLEMQKNQRAEVNMHRVTHRPWGHYETIDRGELFQVKRITVKPGASLSLQLHQHRSEHWVVVRGVAEVMRGNEVFTIKANQSTYIPLGVKHRLSNLTEEDLDIIEVQSGTYLGEDDIIRLEDVYGRVECPA